MNTKISYLYRDAGNNKVHNSCIVSGTLSEEEIREIISCLDEGEYFKPELVDMPAERFSECDPELDHSWMELCEDDFEETEAPATAQMTAKELLEKFRQNKGLWDKKKEGGCRG